MFLSFALIILLFNPTYALNTEKLNPSGNFGDFTNPDNAYQDNGFFAIVRGGESHQFWGYDINIPSGSSIDGIEVILEGKASSRFFDTAEIAVELSWNGGASWTSTANTARFTGSSENSYSVGGSNYNWGRNWSGSELTGSNFVIKLQDETFPWWPILTASLDWVSVRIYYSGGATIIAPADISLLEVERGKITETGSLNLNYSGSFSGNGQITVSTLIGFGNPVPGTVLSIKGGDLLDYQSLIIGANPQGSLILKSDISGSGSLNDIYLRLDASEVSPGASYLGSSWEYLLTYTLSGP